MPTAVPPHTRSPKARLARQSSEISLPSRKPSAIAAFDFTGHMRELCRDMVARSPSLSHIDLDRVAIGLGWSRAGASGGMLASVTPLRFEAGSTVQIRRGRAWKIQRLVDGSGREMLYVLRFFVPRFVDLEFEEKLITIFHELWHISPQFDGDLRRHPGRCFAHSHSRRQYDAAMSDLAQQWLATNPSPARFEFLQCGRGELQSRFGRIVGARVPLPKVVLVRE